MGVLAKVVLGGASAVIVAGLVGIVFRELTSQQQRNVNRPLRDALEVLTPAIAAVGLIVWLWAGV
jgi:hypothetical protein